MNNFLDEIPYSEITDSLKALQAFGINKEAFTRISKDEVFAKNISDFIQNGGAGNMPLHYKNAREIMGDNFWGMEEWTNFFGISFANNEILEAAQFPWSKDFLLSPCSFSNGRSIKETHFAFLGLPRIKYWDCVLRKNEDKFKEKFPTLTNPNHYIKPEEVVSFSNWIPPRFVDKICEFRWYLFLKEAVLLEKEDSKKFIRDEQTKWLDEAYPMYEIPKAMETTTFYILYRIKFDSYPNSEKEIWGNESEKNPLFLDRMKIHTHKDLLFASMSVYNPERYNEGYLCLRLK
jgi:hypothetical protein